MNVKEALHAKRAVTEEHVKQLQKDGREGIRYTAMMPDMPFLFLGLLCDIGWLIHLAAGIMYFAGHGFHSVWEILALIALAAVMAGIAYIIYMNRIHEKEIATRFQKNMSFGLTILGGLAGGMIGIVQMISCTDASSAVICMTIGGFLNFAAGLPVYLSFKKGIIYGVQ